MIFTDYKGWTKKVRELESNLESDEVTLFLPAAYYHNRDSLDGVALIWRSYRLAWLILS